jgi:hypothetical protein
VLPVAVPNCFFSRMICLPLVEPVAEPINAAGQLAVRWVPLVEQLEIPSRL